MDHTRKVSTGRGKRPGKEGLVNSGFRRNGDLGKAIGFGDGHSYPSGENSGRGESNSDVSACKSHVFSPLDHVISISEKGMEREQAGFAVAFVFSYQERVVVKLG